MFLPKETAAAWQPHDQVHPAPRLARVVELLDDRLVVLEGVHLGEVVVADDLGQALISTCGS